MSLRLGYSTAHREADVTRLTQVECIEGYIHVVCLPFLAWVKFTINETNLLYTLMLVIVLDEPVCVVSPNRNITTSHKR